MTTSTSRRRSMVAWKMPHVFRAVPLVLLVWVVDLPCAVLGATRQQQPMGTWQSCNDPQQPAAGSRFLPWTTKKISEVRGGGDQSPSLSSSEAATNVTIVEDYIAAVEEKDARHRGFFSHRMNDLERGISDAENELQRNKNNDNNNNKIRHSQMEEDARDDLEEGNRDASDHDGETASPDETTDAPPPTGEDTADPAVGVGVKTPHHKKSNAVGDPDGDDSDDDNSDEDSSADWELEEELDNLELEALMDPSEQLHVEVVVEDDMMDDDNEHTSRGDDDLETKSASSGGVGVKLGQRLGRRNSRVLPQADWRSSNSDSAAAFKTTASLDQEQLLDAWMPHVYLPPSTSALAYLVKNARFMDSASKNRLDRRTLYACLLLEWLHQSASNRKFLDSATSQTLQASLSLATQPKWRQSFPRPSAVRLFENEVGKSCTLGIQETIAMALAHSLGAAMVILDDEILVSIRQKLLHKGYNNEDVKPAALLRALLDSARGGAIKNKKGGSIAECMKRDLALGLDDPFDERAKSSCDDMQVWEKEWHNITTDASSVTRDKHIPLVLFIRTQSANSLLKSKSAVDVLLKECNSNDGVNMVVLGRGIDARTVALPKDNSQESVPHQLEHNNFQRDLQQRQLPGTAPFFGFSPQNQNASGQNDPPGSRRFNIFLSRTVDTNGYPGILGAIAPPEAGNLFPQMMAMQARERLKHTDHDSPLREELEKWSQLIIQQMQRADENSDGSPLPPPQFFNATLQPPYENGENPLLPAQTQAQPQEVIKQTLENAMSDLLERLSQMGGEDDGPPPTSPSDLSPDLHKAFAQVLRNPNLRKGIADNLLRAAPALSDPKCQGVMVSVYVPPPNNRGKLPGQNNGVKPQSNVGGWFQKILNNQEAADATAEATGPPDEGRRKNARQKRNRTMAAAAAVIAAKNAQDKTDGVGSNTEKQENKAERNLVKLEALCRSIPIKVPSDPVRAKSWDGWTARERGAVIFRQNRKALNEELRNHKLTLQQHTGTRGAGSALRQMLSVRDITEEMDEVIKCSVELEAAKGQRLHESPEEIHEKEMDLGIDITLTQLLSNDDEVHEVIDVDEASHPNVKYLHPSSLESALSLTCRVSPSPSGGLSVGTTPASHRTKDEIAALAQDKHERALVSQVVSPQDIGVTYDMIGGLTHVKELLRQSITYPLKFPHLYSEGIAREAVKGVLLFGPPGTGKTMLAKAVATEGGASFLSVDASSVENKWLGESEKNAKAVFTLARRLAPCVIFIDEVDSLLSSREGTSDDSAHGTLTSVKTTMMSEWDGLNSGTNGSGEAGSDRVVVIGSTNRPFDLDEAVLRRFPRRILVDLPDMETRREILEVTLAENRLDPDVNLTVIAERLEGYTGSDIKEVCREAVVQISHEQAKLLDQGFVNESREDVTQGSLQRLRPVNMEDFEKALSKLKRSVSEKGRELSRVWEWNDEYGEVKKEKKNHLPHLMNMYL